VIQVFFDHVIDPQTHHLRLFFDDQWNWRNLTERASYGHDIEASWLLVEAADELGDASLLARARAEAVVMAERVYCEALEPDSSLLYESMTPGVDNGRATQKHWWPHAEAVVGFYNAFQISGQQRFAAAAEACWNYIEAKFVDRTYGDWFKVLDCAGVPVPDQRKVGAWECPYHQSRVGFEMLRRLMPY
jgi:mannobiose 2-epimerase